MAQVSSAPTPQAMTKEEKDLDPYNVIGKTATQEYAVKDADVAFKALLDFEEYHSVVWGSKVELTSGEKGKVGAVYSGKHDILPNVMTNWANLVQKDETSISWMEEECKMKLSAVKDTEAYKMMKLTFDFGLEAMANNVMTGVHNYPKWMKFEIVPYKGAYKLTVTQKKGVPKRTSVACCLLSFCPCPQLTECDATITDVVANYLPVPEEFLCMVDLNKQATSKAKEKVTATSEFLKGLEV